MTDDKRDTKNDETPGRAPRAVESLREKAHETTSVHGHKMPAADIFKLCGLAAFFVIMGVVLFLIWPYIHEIFEPGGLERVMADVHAAGPAGVLILLAIQFLQIVVAFIPGEVVQIAAGLIYGPWLGALIIFVGCVISSAFIFVLVRKLGAPFVQAMVPAKYQGKFDEFEESGKLNIVVFILFLIPGMPKDVFTYLVPLTTMRLRDFILLTNFARIPGIVVSTYAAAGLANGDYLESLMLFGVVAVIAVLAMVFYDRIIKALGARAGKGAATQDEPRRK
ncbi:MAG: TVP38/TMEM64 family protein [Eggerthellaceae bacterium]|nr:TVP38/TMEM64 family protein [Eggerthellaceae bacterium]